ncbi:MAG: response regulator transcription factor [Bacteroidales bacterium]|nr:response regulator transcription factor [Bacteroidales bacterium]MCF8390110.1 response regulator transcription factor [Bacteroidales bacterium]
MEKNLKTRILLAEDDENLGSLLQEYLHARNYEADWLSNGEKAFKAFERNHYDICILDVMMPVKDGFTLATEIRMLNRDIPIVFLTAKSMKEDVLEGFGIGADDYITKPFSMEELIFRIEAIMRRIKGGVETKDNTYEIGAFKFDTQKQSLICGDFNQKLTTKETDLLKLLCINMNRVLERNFALKAIWIDDNYFNARSMDVYITKLRKYFKEDPRVQIINVHGKGYKLVVDSNQKGE